MYIVLGLGNYGTKYEHTWHNAGCDSLNILAQRNGISLTKRRFKALYGEGRIGGQKVLLAFPQTYMNLSGDCAAKLAGYFGVPSQKIIVIYDDVDLPKGSLRLRPHGSAGSHNGMRSLVERLKTQDFPRIRVGIGAPPQHMDISDFVTSKVPRDEWQLMFDAYMAAAKAAEEIIESGIERAMLLYNGFGKAENSEKKSEKESEKESV
ncbi:MAG: aminoacyl-tRNA hydrolase [Christensenellales bacterium]|jgi:PTH1 family peptidyl-tRNA hydrolase